MYRLNEDELQKKTISRRLMKWRRIFTRSFKEPSSCFSSFKTNFGVLRSCSSEISKQINFVYRLTGIVIRYIGNIISSSFSRYPTISCLAIHDFSIKLLVESLITSIKSSNPVYWMPCLIVSLLWYEKFGTFRHKKDDYHSYGTTNASWEFKP